MCYSEAPMRTGFVKRFEEEIQALERELKKELPREIQRARELGDLRENAEYQAAKERQRFVEARIGMLRARLSQISLLNLDKLPRDRAALGSTVRLREADGGTVIYQLVMPEDADPGKGAISTASPIGRAIVGKELGDEISVPTPRGVRAFEIVELTTIHEA